ncbi:hypothetical protein ACSHT2_10200 [Bradyrhizobium sp. PUT101]|uniref:hypothetical protein n=1 Tax=Bradyrhizobium sp. PUT101 TaxID=3447427 RepID=UPI003F865B0F
MAYRQFAFAGRLGIVGDHVPLTEQAFPGGECHFGPDRDFKWWVLVNEGQECFIFQ